MRIRLVECFQGRNAKDLPPPLWLISIKLTGFFYTIGIFM
ncbi:hypothetical protein EDWATA_02787 [Edwardsiella tarda ATCC 23685]|uniref:Uncharacterized protein n=1 Tax=Edwardsiella tarda ATCC 23685 TaxID=500638 RepID=D4F7Q1_EDWTA|nr:hypothetical protein EDWATA_02787 [Edwardsiella tarda ATCC 23685]